MLVARVAGLGYKLARVHSDKGREFMGKSVQKWASSRGVIWSNTGGDNWKANGRVESVIGRLKGLTTSLLIQASLPKENWAFAWRYAAERFLRTTLKYLGGIGSESMLRFGSKLLARQRSWKLEDFSPKVVPATLLAPARNVSRAWLVRTEKGEYYNTSVLFPEVLQEEPEQHVACPTVDVDGKVEAAAPGRRYREKTRVAVLCKDLSPQDLGDLLDSACASADPPLSSFHPGPNPHDPVDELDPEPEDVSGLQASIPKASEHLHSIRQTPPIKEPSDYVWKFPMPLTSNEHRLQCEDVLAQALATSPAYTFAKAHSLICHSMWSKTTTSPGSAQTRSEIRYVLGLFRHGGVSGVTRSTIRFPGFTRLLAKMVQSCWPTQAFTSMALVTATDIPPHKDRNNIPKSNLLIPIRTPYKGLLVWTELQQGDLIMGSVANRTLDNNRAVAGQECLLFAGETMKLDATRWHAVQSNGKRCDPALVLVAYSLTHLDKISSDTQSTLVASGIPLPAALVAVQQGGKVEGEGTNGGAQGEAANGGARKKKFQKSGSEVGVEREEEGVVFPNDAGSAALRKFAGEQADGCWCTERTCQLCKARFNPEPTLVNSESDADSWAEGSEDSWFVVSPQDSGLFKVEGEGTAADWEIVASHEGWSLEGAIPNDGTGPLSEQVAEEMDSARLHLEACLQGERRILKRVTKEGDQQEAVDTAANLCHVESHVQALEQELVRMRESGPDQVKADGAAGLVDPPVVLQTKTVPTEVALAQWSEGWKEATLKELEALIEVKKALRPISEARVKEMLSEGTEVVRLPTKLVYTIKAGSGRRKCRLVLCGNSAPVVQESSLEKRLATFAGGVDVGLLRLLLADAAAEQLDLVTFDVSTAFLNAPARARNLREEHYGKRQVTVAAPPKSLIRLGVVDPGTLWEVLLAMYGLDTSPRDWMLHRSEILVDLKVPSPAGVLRLKRSAVDSSIWYIFKDSQAATRPLRWVAIYVDDFLSASRDGLADWVYEAANGVWECGPLERVVTGSEGPAVRFNGLELLWSEN